ncbi:UTP--glucose-1-phosphate uridylyltransferase [Chloropicon primus]|uniref:UTP--glucose-1-phosphate uridylyltransferase n=2 Tax=Chloropicon primus TaxID=1764295 RepID=A0A5B8MD37_9CHLO|nr:UTP--glucose-1-phosphate uridylyltransferase [Chloropicon primus]|eukprot:QDZ18034.1 UTP--glucose-1-phosphate uridylyltransferase [Chloropicon primus]
MEGARGVSARGGAFGGQRFAGRGKSAQSRRVVAGYSSRSVRRRRWRQTQHRSGTSVGHVVLCRAALDRSPSNRLEEKQKRDGLNVLESDLRRLKDLVLCLKGQDAGSKVAILRKDEAVQSSGALGLEDHLARLSLRQQVVWYSVLALRQGHVLRSGSEDDASELSLLLNKLELVEKFYDSIGGVLGYQLRVLELIAGDAADEDPLGDSREEVLFPHGQDISKDNAATRDMVADGLRSIPVLAEVYPVGGAGDRLGLIDETTGQPLPTALLPYCGRSLLENLVRDVQARENLYYRIFGERHCTPIAIMTSDAKGNHEHITQLCKDNDWFGRRSDCFSLFRQPLVPVVNGQDGKWLVSGKFEILMKPSGHGAIWKLMYDREVLQWLGRHNRKSALVRQISNPMAATDTTMIALAGKGHSGGHTFGFASCERKVGASEGCNVLKSYVDSTDEAVRHAITCVEYTEFEKYGMEDSGHQNSEGEEVSRFPANTNILYFDVERVQSKLDEGAKLGQRGTSIILPGMIFNRKKTLRYTNMLTGEQEEVKGGRLECSMQNLADVFRHETGGAEIDESTWLPTFLLYNKRPKVTSSAKKRYEPSTKKGSISQTPEGSFYDLMSNAGEVLAKCGMERPDMNTVSEYLEEGPSFVFLFHPALGPLWSVISQKIRGGRLGHKSELVLEISEVAMEGVDVQGSLTVRADNVMGGMAPVPRTSMKEIVYSDRCGKCKLENVKVENKGIDYSGMENIYWKHKVARLESCSIVLEGNSEFEAKNVTLRGNQSFVVPDGHKISVYAGDSGEVVSECRPLAEGPSWTWQYALEKRGVVLSMKEGGFEANK